MTYFTPGHGRNINCQAYIATNDHVQRYRHRKRHPGSEDATGPRHVLRRDRPLRGPGRTEGRAALLSGTRRPRVQHSHAAPSHRRKHDELLHATDAACYAGAEVHAGIRNA